MGQLLVGRNCVHHKCTEILCVEMLTEESGRRTQRCYRQVHRICCEDSLSGSFSTRFNSSHGNVKIKVKRNPTVKKTVPISQTCDLIPLKKMYYYFSLTSRFLQKVPINLLSRLHLLGSASIKLPHVYVYQRKPLLLLI